MSTYSIASLVVTWNSYEMNSGCELRSLYRYCYILPLLVRVSHSLARNALTRIVLEFLFGEHKYGNYIVCS